MTSFKSIAKQLRKKTDTLSSTHKNES